YYEDEYDDEEYTDEEVYDNDETESYSNDSFERSYSADVEEVKKDDSYISNTSDNSKESLNNTRKSTKEHQSRNRSYGANEMTVSIKEPLEYEDGQDILDDIIAKKTVILNLEMLEMDKKTQIFYFVSGGLYSLRGSIQNVTKDIYVLAPEGVDVNSGLKDTISNKSLHQI
ncbi:cell division protein SepF, partial [Rhodovulum adriaticum]|uniref:cell division protein SepF n=1 Tax=Rhodovulum adriaticum TaxID=35804 RepID=UPI001905DDF9